MELTDGPLYQEAKLLAKKHQRDFFLNVHGHGMAEYISINAWRGARVCAVAHKGGEIELAVQSPFAKVERRIA